MVDRCTRQSAGRNHTWQPARQCHWPDTLLEQTTRGQNGQSTGRPTIGRTRCDRLATRESTYTRPDTHTHTHHKHRHARDPTHYQRTHHTLPCTRPEPQPEPRQEQQQDQQQRSGVDEGPSPKRPRHASRGGAEVKPTAEEKAAKLKARLHKGAAQQQQESSDSESSDSSDDSVFDPYAGEDGSEFDWNDQSTFDGTSTAEILGWMLRWAHTLPAGHKTFPAGDKGLAFLGATVGQGHWAWRTHPGRRWVQYCNTDPWINSVLEFNYRRQARTFQVTDTDGNSWNIDLDERMRRSVDDPGIRNVLSRR